MRGEGVDGGDALLPRETLRRQTELLLGELPHLTAYDLAREVGVSAARVLQFWRALGFSGVPASAPVFTRSDADALASTLRLLRESGLSDAAFRTLLRAAAHSADRIAVWQVEALVEDAELRLELDDLTARILVLDTIADTIEPLGDLMQHAWRRHLLALLARTEESVAQAGRAPDDDSLPLERAIGFIDVVSYTSQSAHLSATELAAFVTVFEERARNVVTDVGARVVKTMGDGVLFVADDLDTGVLAALALQETYSGDDVAFQVHGGLTWGRILARSGDVFGATVNLASRLADIAVAGELLTNIVTWALIEQRGLTSIVAGQPKPVAQVPGIGEVEPVQLSRALDHLGK